MGTTRRRGERRPTALTGVVEYHAERRPLPGGDRGDAVAHPHPMVAGASKYKPVVDASLTLDGLRIIYYRNQGAVRRK